MRGKVSDSYRIFQPLHLNKMYGSIQNNDTINLLKNGARVKVAALEILLNKHAVSAKEPVQHEFKLLSSNLWHVVHCEEGK